MAIASVAHLFVEKEEEEEEKEEEDDVEEEEESNELCISLLSSPLPPPQHSVSSPVSESTATPNLIPIKLS